MEKWIFNKECLDNKLAIWFLKKQTKIKLHLLTHTDIKIISDAFSFLI